MGQKAITTRNTGRMYSDSPLRRVIIFLQNSGTRIEVIHTIAPEATPERKTSQLGIVPEEISHLKYNHHLVSTSGARLHADHSNLRIGMVQVAAGEPAQVLCR